MSPDEIMKLIEQSRKDIGQRYSQIPQTYQQFNSEADSQIVGARGAYADKIKELFQHDSQVAQVYMPPQEAPGPHAQGYTPQTERIIDPTIGQRASSQQTQATAGELGDIINTISSRKNMLKDNLDRALGLIDYAVKAKEAEARLLEAELNAALKQEELRQKGSKDKQAKSLQALYDAITGFQNKSRAATPFEVGTTETQMSPFERNKKGQIIQGKTVGKSASDKKFAELKKKYPGADIRWSKNKDGTYTYAVTPRNMQPVSESEAPAYENPEETLRRMLGATVAQEPDIASTAQSLYETLTARSPEAIKPKEPTQGEDKITAVRRLRQDIADAPANTNPVSMSQVLRLHYPELTIDEIQAEIATSGKFQSPTQ